MILREIYLRLVPGTQIVLKVDSIVNCNRVDGTRTQETWPAVLA
jgi:hypothetical protein